MFKIKRFFTPVSKFEFISRLIFYGLVFLIAFSFLVFIFFLYQRFYLTITQAEEIVVLKSQLALETLDMELYAKVKKRLADKKNKSLVNWREKPDPFLPYR